MLIKSVKKDLAPYTPSCHLNLHDWVFWDRPEKREDYSPVVYDHYIIYNLENVNVGGFILYISQKFYFIRCEFDLLGIFVVFVILIFCTA